MILSLKSGVSAHTQAGDFGSKITTPSLSRAMVPVDAEEYSEASNVPFGSISGLGVSPNRSDATHGPRPS